MIKLYGKNALYAANHSTQKNARKFISAERCATVHHVATLTNEQIFRKRGVTMKRYVE